MADEKNAPNEGQEVPESLGDALEDGSKPWFYFFAGSMLLVSMGIVLAALLIQFDDQRRFNLRPQTRQLNAIIVQALRDQYVPLDNIETSPEEEQWDQKSIWTHQKIEVTLPAQLNLDGLKRLLEKRMSDLKVEVVERQVANVGMVQSMNLGPYEFAMVVLRQEAAPAEQLLDIRDDAYRIGQSMAQYLEAGGVAPEAIQIGTPEDKEDRRARWTQTRVDVSLPEQLSVGELRARLQDLLGQQNVDVVTPSGMPQALQLQLRGLPIVSLFLKDRAGTMAALPIQVDPAMAERGDGAMAAPPAAEDDLPAMTPVSDLEPMEPEAVDPTLEMMTPQPGTTEFEPLVEGAKATPPPPRNVSALEPMVGNEGFAGPGVLRSPPRIAIILDDGGNAWARSEEVLALDNRLTLSILPHTSFAQQTAEAALSQGFEVMLHMPMETFSKTEDPGPGKILVSMADEEIQARTHEALLSVPGATGINNHTGSLFTSDREKMRAFMVVVQEMGLFFVDSRTHADTLAYDVAQEMGVLSAKRNVFLDNERNRDAILAQLEELVETAKRDGEAIGIGHFYRETAAVLAEAIPRMDDMGIQLVHASELVH